MKGKNLEIAAPVNFTSLEVHDIAVEAKLTAASLILA